MGSGMAFPWSLLERIDLATGHIVEDLKLGLDCALAGSPPMYLPAASVESEFPINEQGSRSQRERWEHGHLSMLTSEIPGLMVQAIRHRNGKLFAMCVDVCIPPLSLLGVVILSNALLALVLSSLHWISPFTIAVAMAALMIFGVTVLVGWWSVGRRLVSSIDLIMIPIYVFSKIPIYIGFFLRKRVAWIRTRRD
jgi:cellulose synthase/poly-beta-1,6-N-acetylglucosamine synthase-like glycosyltransferase